MNEHQDTPNTQPSENETTERPQPLAQTPLPRRRFLAGSAALLAVVAGAGVAARQSFRRAPATPTPTPSLPPVIAGGTDPLTPTPRREPTPSVDERANGYVVTAPRTLRANGVETVSFALFEGSRPVTSRVAVSVADKTGKVVAEGGEWVRNGRGGVPIRLGALAAGEYSLLVSGNGFTDKATVRVEDGTILFLETDKPIYKPGQTVRIRVVALDVNLRPVATTATVEAQDAKGIKVFKKVITTDDFGMTTLDLPLSTEPNLGVWKLRAAVGESVNGNRATQLDVRVEEYVLPKYEVKATLPKDWALVNEPITGTVAAGTPSASRCRARSRSSGWSIAAPGRSSAASPARSTAARPSSCPPRAMRRDRRATPGRAGRDSTSPCARRRPATRSRRASC